jgi:hypothetical protein
MINHWMILEIGLMKLGRNGLNNAKAILNWKTE